MQPIFDDTPETALEWARTGVGAALATVVETWGSAPRPVGSQLAVSGRGEIAGSVSGGCVEGAVVAEAIDAIGDGKPRMLTYGVTDDDAFAVGLACGGTIRIAVEPIGGSMPQALLEQLCRARSNRQAVAYELNTTTWQGRLVLAAEGEILPELAARFRSDKSGFEGENFIAVHNPPLRMAIVGAVHIAQPLVAMARLAGFDVCLVDPRESFASSARFPEERLSHDWPDEALASFGLDARTAVVTLTHDPKLDDPAITETLKSDAFYLGCLGSTRTHAKRAERLRQAGVSEEAIARIHAPVGLDIGAKSPAEIAVSIMAEIIDVLRKR